MKYPKIRKRRKFHLQLLFIREIKVGCPSNQEVFMGALNSKPHLEKVKKYVKYAVEDGGSVLCGEGVDLLLLPEDNKQVFHLGF